MARNGVRRRACCCCMPSCTAMMILRTAALCILLSVALAYAIKALWMHAEWTHTHHPSPSAPSPDGNGTSTSNTTSEPFSWRAATLNQSFVAWDRRYYMPALGAATLGVVVCAFFAWYIISTCAQCGCRCCQKVRSRCIDPCGRRNAAAAAASTGEYSQLEKGSRGSITRSASVESLSDGDDNNDGGISSDIVALRSSVSDDEQKQKKKKSSSSSSHKKSRSSSSKSSKKHVEL